MTERSKSSTGRLARSPLVQLMLARLREFYRQPEAIFWVYGFPILMVVALGIAFRNQPVERIAVDVEAGPAAHAVVEALTGRDKFDLEIHHAEACKTRLRTGKTQVVVIAASDKPTYAYFYDPTQPESLLARNAVDDALQRAAGRADVVEVSDRELDEAGGRYVDFLIPGLLGMNLMGGGLWGVGFITVDMRIRKLLKRFLATPMKKSHFLLGLMTSRLLFLIPEVLVLLAFARVSFGVVNYGSWAAVVVLTLLGAITFSGIGLLVASRAKTLETVSGLMNLVMLPMWILSGIFFAPDRFPEVAQPIIRFIPLTPLIEALRAVMLEGAALSSQLDPIAILLAWGVVSFILALRWFRWN
jgi:ABC-type multidrug transport system permease subunit